MCHSVVFNERRTWLLRKVTCTLSYLRHFYDFFLYRNPPLLASQLLFPTSSFISILLLIDWSSFGLWIHIHIYVHTHIFLKNKNTIKLKTKNWDQSSPWCLDYLSFGESFHISVSASTPFILEAAQSSIKGNVPHHTSLPPSQLMDFYYDRLILL